VHVDDVRLSRDPAVWPETAATLDAWARAAEGAGARLSFRFREWFARGDTSGFVRGLVARGHEAGWHAHGWRLRAARDAVVAAGGDARVAAPGLVQARAPSLVLARARTLGARVITDRPEGRMRAYDGWLAREAFGMTVMDVSVAPWEWGLDFDRLASCVEAASRWEAPPGSVPFFGATWHEHDSVVGFERFVGRFGQRIVVSGAIGRQDAETRRRQGGLGEMASGAEGAPFSPSSWRLGVSAPWRLPPFEKLGHGPIQLVVVHAGESGLRQRLRFLGLDAIEGCTVWLWERSPGSRAPGNPVHVAETRAVLDLAAREGPVGMLSWSGGVVNALLAADARVRFLVDVEGPADRFSLVPPGGNELSARDRFDDDAWAGLEAVDLVRGFAGAYVRVQGARDHVHGPTDWHARRMVAAAPRGRLVRVPGRVDRAGATVVALVRELSPG
jgi:hypothetical protein